MLKLAIVAIMLALASANFEADWATFKQKHNKVYSGDEDVLRRYVYQSNMKIVQEHNELYAQGKSSYYMGENQFSDWTRDEFLRKRAGLKFNPSDFDEEVVAEMEKVDLTGLPETVDWRDKNAVTPVKDQAMCESCWAFSTTGSLEGQHAIATGKLVSLSESNLMNCAQAFGIEGCNFGAYMSWAFMYIKANGGIDTEASYPYIPKDQPCRFNKSNIGATIKGYKNVTKFSEEALQKAVATVGPITVAIEVMGTFQSYKKGIYDEPLCHSKLEFLNHGVLVVGYGVEDGKDYWLVKNSWNKSWGDEGYIKMSRNKKNQCGIATYAMYPIV